jgi:uncharacterized membrane protein YbhN (UPF0104 family)
LLVILLWRVVDYAELRDIVGGMRLPWALAALAAVQLIIVLRTLRWIEIHEASGLSRAPLGYHLRLTYATSLATMALPQILNPLSRVVLLLQDGYQARRALPGSILEKLLDLVAYVSFGVYGSIALVTIFGGIIWWAIGLALVALGAGAGLYLGRSRLSGIAEALIERFPGSGERADADRSEMAREIVSLNPRLLLRLYGWSLAIALTQATLLFFLARSLGVGLSYQFIVAVWGIIALSFLLPISVNGIGTREAILVVAFDAADRSTDAAVALGLLVLVVVAIGSAPGAIEWLRRAATGTGGAAPRGTPPGDPMKDRADDSAAPESVRRVGTEGRAH